MRLTTEMWVSALLRRVFAEGGFGAVVRRGGDSAGAVFILLRGRAGGLTLYSPAPQTGYGEARPDDRLFTEALAAVDDEQARQKLDREQRFDPDLWIVELEPGGSGPDGLFQVMKG
jgi:hypothetical protein